MHNKIPIPPHPLRPTPIKPFPRKTASVYESVAEHQDAIQGELPARQLKQEQEDRVVKYVLYVLGVVLVGLVGGLGWGLMREKVEVTKGVSYTEVDNNTIGQFQTQLFQSLQQSYSQPHQSPEPLTPSPPPTPSTASATSTSSAQSQHLLANNPELKQILKDGRYFDIHYFVEDQHVKQSPRVVSVGRPRDIGDVYEKREVVHMGKSVYQIETVLTDMRFKEPRQEPIVKGLTKQLKDRIYFAHTLSLNPDNKDYLEAEYYYYDKKYDIGKYGKQLPLCLALVGKNNGNVIVKMYESIKRQNYTNYRIAHVDDNSDDGTIEKTLQFLDRNPDMKSKTSIVVQPYERNALYNRHYANTKLCRDGDIIIDLDTDDYLIGNQVFQLVNSLYQSGYEYNNNKQQVWSLFMNFITAPERCCPYSFIFGQIDEKIIKEGTYRVKDSWRTTHLRTYLWKLYSKIDRNDFVDKANIREGEFYGEAPDLFMMDSVLELSAPKHMRVIDQYVYFYTGSGDRDQTYPQYCSMSGRSLPIYEPLDNLQENPKRGPSKATPSEKQLFSKMTERVHERFSKLKKRFNEAYQKGT